jgi:hypothetical protein
VSARPEWTNRVRHFLSDHILDDPSYASDGSDDALLEEIEEAVYAILCRAYGHDIVDDQCGIPAHRYCVYCNKRVGDLT